MTKTDPALQQDFPPGMGQPALRALASAGIHNLSQVTQHTAKELLDLHGMGPKGIRLLRAALAGRGLHFRDEKP